MPYTMRSATRFVRRFAPRATSHVARAALATVALLAGLTPAFLLAPAASAHAAGAASGSVHAVRLDSPAVVRIIKVEAGRVICKACYQGQDIPFPLDGKSSYDLAFTGSGTLISPDGYILTADHVAEAGLADNSYFLQYAISELAQKAGISVDQATQAFQESQQAGQIEYDIHVAQLTAFLSTAYIGSVRDVAQVSDPQVTFPVTRVVASSPAEKQDVAIVKIEGHDLPNVRLAPTGSVHVQDRVSAIAFPGDADVGNSGSVDSAALNVLAPKPGMEADLSNLLTPTVEDGQIIAIKHLDDGTSLYQTDQIGNHGSSGGAVINDRGEIVGVLDALNDVNSGNPTRVVDLVTNDVIASYVQQAGITNSGQGAFMSRWTQAVDALDSGDACQASQARDGLRQLSAEYPRFSAIQPFMQQADSQSAGARCLPSTGALAGFGGLFFLLVGAVAAVLLVLHRQRVIVLPEAVATRLDGWPLLRRSAAAGQSFGSPAVAPMSPITPMPQPVGAAPVGQYDPSASYTGQYASAPSASYAAPYAAPYTMPAPYPTAYAAPYAAPYGTPVAPAYADLYDAPAHFSMVPQHPECAASSSPAATAAFAAVSETEPPAVPAPAAWDELGATREVRHCVNGHTVADAAAHFCPTCGAHMVF